MKKFLIQVFFLLVVIFGSLYYSFQKIPNNLPFGQQQPTKQTQVVVIGSNRLTVEVADTASKRSQGLGGKDALDPNSGMLFIFENANTYRFWMKGVKFPLDLIWIKGNTIVDISNNVPPADPIAPDEMIPVYQPKEPADKVLEVNGGFAGQHSIKIGDSIQIVAE